MVPRRVDNECVLVPRVVTSPHARCGAGLCGCGPARALRCGIVREEQVLRVNDTYEIVVRYYL